MKRFEIIYLHKHISTHIYTDTSYIHIKEIKPGKDSCNVKISTSKYKIITHKYITDI